VPISRAIFLMKVACSSSTTTSKPYHYTAVFLTLLGIYIIQNFEGEDSMDY